MGKTVAALGLIGVIVMAASCSSSGNNSGSPTTVPGPSTSIASTSSAPATGVDDASLRSVNWSDVQYPMDCGANGTADVRSVEYATPAPDVEVAVVEVSCQLVATTPPSALFVYEPAAPGAQPRLIQALVNYTDGWLFYVFRSSASVVAASVAGYSTVDVVRSTPDISATLKWVWQGSSYRLVSSVPSHARYCITGPCAPTTATGGS